MRVRVRGLGLVMGFAAIVLLGGIVPSAASAATPAVGYQLNQGHNGSTGDAVTTASSGPKELWSDNLGGPVSYPLLADGHIYVTAANTGGSGTTLVALNPATGALAWGPKDLGGTYNWSGLAFDDNKVFTVNDDGVMEGFNASTGALLWALQLPGQWSFSSPPTAENGYVYTGGAGDGGTVYAVNETTGDLVWAQPVENGDSSSPAVSGSGVWVSYACGQTYDFNPTSGALIWHRDTACEGGGGLTPVLDGNALFVRDFSFPAILNASTGSVLAPFSAGPAPAANSTAYYDLQGSTLTATSVKTLSQAWRFTGDGTLDTAPLVAGGTVLIGGSSGKLYGLNAATGAQQWAINVGSAIPAPEEASVGQPLTGLATAAGLILVPTASGELEAFK